MYACADGSFTVSDAEGPAWDASAKVTPQSIEETVSRLSKARLGSALVTRPERFVMTVQERLDHAFANGAVDGGQLARNLMIAAGVPWANRRRGDTSFRIDSVFHLGGDKLGIAEAEYTYEGLISAPRCLLDDCAIASARLGTPLDAVLPIVVCVRLPNARSEYYDVVYDINRVLGLRICTLTLGLLLLIRFSGRAIDERIIDAAYVDRESKSLVEAARLALGRDIDAASMPGGALAPEK